MSRDVGKISPSRMSSPDMIHTLTFTRFRITGIIHAKNATANTLIRTNQMIEDEPLNKIIPKNPNKRIATSGIKYFFIRLPF
jgi:hypothetical protein